MKKQQAKLLTNFKAFSAVFIGVAILVALMNTQALFASFSTNGTQNASQQTTSAHSALLAIKIDEPATYIVVLQDPALASYRGGIADLAPTNPAVNGERKLDASSTASQAYLSYLAGQRATSIANINAALGRSIEVTYQYATSLNGFAARMTASEAALVAKMPGIRMIQREKMFYPTTDAGPNWIGATAVWGGNWDAMTYWADMAGNNEVPPVTTNATGTGHFMYNFYTHELQYNVTVSNPDALSFTAMHIHNAPAGVNGPVIINFNLTATSATSFNASGSATLTAGQQAELVNGNLYVNAHTTAHTGGEIRGQIMPTGSLGEGVIVGVIDTGVDPWNPSFLGTGGDGYVHTNPLGSGTYLGVCDPNNTGGNGVVAYDPTFPCNDKLIGVWGYTASDASPRDTDGHGSHTSSTSAGNFVMSSTITTTSAIFQANISGVAPHANIIVYDGCIDGGGCPGASLQAGRDQAILDGVDVINYSIGSSTPTGDVWSDPEALSWLAIRDAGIFVANSAGNSGPGDGTVGSPADTPWLTSVGASSHNRTFLNSVILDDGTHPPITVSGESMTGPLATPVEVVFAANYGTAPDANLCPPGGFPPGTFTGQIVVCERGVYGRVAKGQAVLDGGAGGMILAQPNAIGGGPGALSTDPHVLPAVHIDYYAYQDLLNYFANATGTVMGTITGSTLDIDNAHGDIMASFSSRGPNGSVPDLIAPNISAPGRAIWAAYHQGAGGDGTYSYNVIQGTSMASPHLAGAAALVVATHPDWTPAEIQSAIMSTSHTGILDDDGITLATPFDTGSGRVDVAAATHAGFVLDTTTAEFTAANPGAGGDPTTLNLASLGDSNCFGECVWTREISSTLPVTTSWLVTWTVPSGMDLGFVWSSSAAQLSGNPVITLPPFATATFTVTANISGLPSAQWSFGQLWFLEQTLPAGGTTLDLTKDDGGITAVPGDTVVYSLNVTNTGPITATNVTLTESVPANSTFNASASTAGWTMVTTGTYTLNTGDWGPGAGGTVLFAVDVDNPVAIGTTALDNTAWAGADNATAVTASDSTPIDSAPNLEILKTDDGNPTYPGDIITYTITYSNIGNIGVDNVVITDMVPANTTYVSGSPTWTMVTTGTYVLNVGMVDGGESQTATFAVMVDDPLTNTVDTITNTAYISAPGEGMDMSSETTSVQAAAYVIHLPYAAQGAPAPTFSLLSSVRQPEGIAPNAHMPIAVLPVSCAAPSLVNITAFGTSGSTDRLICPQSLEVTDLTAELSGLAEGTIYTDSLSVDPTNGDPYDNTNDGTVRYVTMTVSSAARLVAEVVASEATDIDLYVGTGDTPSAATQVCASTTSSFIEYCNLNDPADGTWWVLVQNWAASGAPPDAITFVTAVVPTADAGDWSVTGPNVAFGDPLTATIGWNEPAFEIGDYWYGDFTLGTNPGAPGNIARINADFEVNGIPVIDTDATSYATSQASGGAITYTFAISNIGTANLNWTINEDNNSFAKTVQGGLLYDNGPLITAVGGGAGGADESTITTGLTAFGLSHSVAANTRVADQFTVTDAAGWTINSFTFYGYQTNSATSPSTFTGVNYNIWDGPPSDANSSIIYTSAPNALVDSVWSNIYRVAAAGNGNTQRPIMTNTASGGFYLPQGTYWVDWQSDGSLASGPWAPPITIVGQTTTGDGEQFNAGAWGPALDSTFPQGFPFQVHGTVGGASQPCDLTSPINWATAVPNNGTTAPGDATDVDLIIDATGLTAGDYSGYLCINSNDLVTPLITVPVSLTVTGNPPVIDVNPGALDATQSPATVTTQTLDISNIGGGILNWNIDELGGGLGFRQMLQDSVVMDGPAVSYVAQGNNSFSANANPVESVMHALPQRNPGTTITQSTSQTIAAGSVSCNSGGYHTDSSYYRAFDLPSFGITDDFNISSVDFGIELAQGTGGTQPVVVNLYAAPSGTAFPAAYPGSFTLIGTANVTVPDQNLTVFNAPISAVAPANSILVFELFTPSGQPTVNKFFIGSNASGQSAPGYIAAAACGITTPTALSAIGFPNMHIVMNVTGKTGGGGGGCATPNDITWFSLDATTGATAAGNTDTLTASFDSTGLSAGVYSGVLCVNSNDPVTPLVQVPVTLTVTSTSTPAISVVKTVGTDPNVCATTDTIAVAAGTDVTYCYTVTNTGNVALTQHDLTDDQLGAIITGLSYNLIPGASAFVTATTTVNTAVTNIGTWTAYNPGPTDVATASDSASVTITGGSSTVTTCRNGINLNIPDNNPTGVNDSLTVAESGTIQDVNVFVNATHSWDGDLKFTVTHNATPVIIIDRPGFTGTGFGCSGDNFPNMTLDDDPGGTPGTPVETSCTNTVPGYPSGSSYTPNNPLSGFDNGNLNGTWTINVSDAATGDTGVLADWCVVVTYGP